MRRFRPGPLLLLVLLCSISASAQQPTSTPAAPTSDPQAVALVQRAMAALTGGIAVTNVTLTGSAHRIAGSDDETGTATLEASAAGDSRVDLNLPSGNRCEIRNHSAIPLLGSFPVAAALPASVTQATQPAGAWSGPDGAMHAMVSHNIMTDAAWFFPALTLEKILAAQNYVFSYIGQETHNGQQVLHVSAVQEFPALSNSSPSSSVQSTIHSQFQALVQRLSRMDFYLDPNSLLLVALGFNQHPDNNALIDIATEIRFSTYQTVNGVGVPMRVEKYMDSGLVLDVQITSVALNSGLSTSAFALQ